MSSDQMGLSKEKIAHAALVIADTEGFEAVSMRRVARELDVGTMSLYYYVKSKDDLVALMDDAFMGEVLLSELPPGWKTAITEIARQTHAALLRHPWSLVSMLTAPPGINAMRHMEQCLEALAETSMTDQQKIELLATVDDFVFGHALRQSANGKEIDAEYASRQLASGAFPRIQQVFINGRFQENDERFERGLRKLLEMATE
jgi:AcrR family transcriptional regulator